MKTTFHQCFTAIGLLLFTACTKENGLIKSFHLSAADTTTNYQGVVTNNFQPDSAGSTWTYHVHEVINIGQSTIGQLFPQAAAAFAAAAAVNGINYPNVIQVESNTIPSALQAVAVNYNIQGVNLGTTTEYYYAENVGLIEEDLKNPFLGISVNTILLHSNIR